MQGSGSEGRRKSGGEIWMVDFLRAVIVFMFAAWFVDSCSCISIMWSPSLIVRLRGAAPERKSFTCNEELVRNMP